jgi:hypothetical protein
MNGDPQTQMNPGLLVPTHTHTCMVSHPLVLLYPHAPSPAGQPSSGRLENEGEISFLFSVVWLDRISVINIDGLRKGILRLSLEYLFSKTVLG